MGKERSRLARWFDRKGWRDIVVVVPYAWLVLFFLLPFIIVLAMSFARRADLSPPIAFLEDWPYIRWDNFERLLGDTVYVRAFFTSLWNAALATFFCLLLGYPMALGITRVSRSWRNLLLMLVILPFWTSFLLRVYAWVGLLGNNSWFNKILTATVNAVLPGEMALSSIPMMNSNFAVVLVMVYSYLPFMILPLYANLEKLDQTLNEAAMDLGSRPWQVFKDVTLPLSVPGIIAGGLLVFIPASGELIIPSLVGNASDPMIGRVISDEFSSARDWPMASAVAVALLLLLVMPMIVYSHFEKRAQVGSEVRS
ncbi:ABC transporter permease [Aestuariivirga sp.]|uniref:ABC transporter permease n=1 Tax=Aestuariivirga sp. TaxID=2650926 RepID=UPI00391C0828